MSLHRLVLAVRSAVLDPVAFACWRWSLATGEQATGNAACSASRTCRSWPLRRSSACSRSSRRRRGAAPTACRGGRDRAQIVALLGALGFLVGLLTSGCPTNESGSWSCAGGRRRRPRTIPRGRARGPAAAGGVPGAGGFVDTQGRPGPAPSDDRTASRPLATPTADGTDQPRPLAQRGAGSADRGRFGYPADPRERATPG